ncbi:MAG: pilin [Candidatus Pacebacteria bacterium]|nr:pilin [Candidatus Paceibacterota bacterium]
MKKLLSIFAAVSLLAVFALPAVSLAQPEILPGGCMLGQKVQVTECDTMVGQFCGEAKTYACDATNIAQPSHPCFGKTAGASVTVAACGPQGRWGICCMLNTLYTVTNWVFYIMTIVAVLMIVFGGFTYITAAGDPTKASKGKGILMFAIIGLAIALIAKLIPSLVRFIIGT